MCIFINSITLYQKLNFGKSGRKPFCISALHMGNYSITKPIDPTARCVNDAEQKCKDAKITHLNQICMFGYFGKQGGHTIKYYVVTGKAGQ